MGNGARRMVRWAVEDGPVGGARGCQRKGTKPAGALAFQFWGGDWSNSRLIYELPRPAHDGGDVAPRPLAG